MNRDQVKGAAQNAAGKCKEKGGQLTGNKTQLGQVIGGNMNRLVYIVGLVVIVLAVLWFFGLR